MAVFKWRTVSLTEAASRALPMVLQVRVVDPSFSHVAACLVVLDKNPNRRVVLANEFIPQSLVFVLRSLGFGSPASLERHFVEVLVRAARCQFQQ